MTVKKIEVHFILHSNFYDSECNEEIARKEKEYLEETYSSYETEKMKEISVTVTDWEE